MHAIKRGHQKLVARGLQMRQACSSKGSATRLADGRLTALGAKIEAERCLLCVDAPCAKACPADTKPDKFIRQLHFENPLGAAETVLDNNPLGGVCGTVCPVSKLCEGACTRKHMDGPVKIGAIQRFLHDFGIDQKLDLPPIPLPTGHKTAVIGAGPAGLAAARELARRGSSVTVYERRAKAGGALNHTLSPLRVDHALVAQEVQRIADMGVKFVFNAHITDTQALQRDHGYDSLFISPGLQGSRLVALKQKNEYWQQQGLISALSFLESSNSLDPVTARAMSNGKTVVIIGGGSVAMDCAITAKSLGATMVHIVARESLLTLPADEDEIRLVREIGGIFHPEAEVVEVDATNVVKLAGFGGHRSDYSATLSASTVIVAAGQVLDESGKLLIDGNSGSGVVVKRMSQPSTAWPTTVGSAVYAGGDAVRGGGETVVQAVADGKHAAAAILPTTPVAPRVRPSLAMDFVGVSFENPFCLSSSPVTNSAEMIARAYDAGFAGAYYKTLNREDKFAIAHPSPRLGVVHGHPSGGMDIGIQNMEQISDRPLEDNLKDIAWLRKHYPTKVTAVSIMGYCDEDWAYLAQAAEGAGAHLLELNFSCPQMARKDAGHHVGQQFDLIQRYTAAAKRAVKIPVVAKLTPNITDMLPAALAAQEGGADAVSAINTVKSISHVDLDGGLLQPLPTIQGHSAVSGFSGKGMRPIGLRFVSELARDKRLRIPISGMGGIYTWRDAAEYLAVGATNLQVTTSVMQHGNRVVEDMIDGLQRYMHRNQWTSLHEMVGRANRVVVEPAQLDTTTEVVSVIDPNVCIGCGICEVACRDGAAHAISMTSKASSGCGGNGGCGSGSATKKVATVDRHACVGCKLCQFVCPVGAISFEVRPRIERPRFSK